MAGMGPAPNPQARRRNPRASGTDAVRLPAEGNRDKAPPWPLPGKMQAGELAAWRELWATPQSVQWRRLGWVRTVARYCRIMVEAEKPKAPSTLSAEARQFEDRLGLSPLAMSRMRPPWVIVEDEVAAARTERDAPAPSSTKQRLRVVDSAAK